MDIRSLFSVAYLWYSLFGKTNCNIVVQAEAPTNCSSNLRSRQLRLFLTQNQSSYFVLLVTRFTWRCDLEFHEIQLIYLPREIFRTEPYIYQPRTCTFGSHGSSTVLTITQRHSSFLVISLRELHRQLALNNSLILYHHIKLEIVCCIRMLLIFRRRSSKAERGSH